MYIDSSALVALLAREPDGPRVAEAIGRADQRRALPIVRLETAMVVAARLRVQPEVANAAITDVFEECGVAVVPVTDEIANEAVSAFARFGKGRHQAKLNFGDCFAYACAKLLREPLMFKGADFSHTDIEAA